MIADSGNVSVSKNVACHADVVIVGISHPGCVIADLRNFVASAHSWVAHSDCVIAELRNFVVSAHSWVAHSDCVTAHLRYFTMFAIS